MPAKIINDKGDWVWRGRPTPTYCALHGGRLRGFINGHGVCDGCIAEMKKEVEAME